MTKITSYNRINKVNIAKTIASVYADPGIEGYIREAILQRVIWMATENDDQGVYKKYIGQPYWSKGAMEQVRENLQNNKPYYKDLRHEHSVPKKEIISRIKASNRSFDEVLDILDKFAHAVVISKEEDKLLTGHGVRSKMPGVLEDHNESDNLNDH